MPELEVFVENIGRVYSGSSWVAARDSFNHYKGEDAEVTLFEDGEPVDEYFPGEDDEPAEDHFRDDVEADADALAGAGFGTDEDYGYYGGEDY